MIDQALRSLLPNGLKDNLAPQAAHEADVMDCLMASFLSYGYERVDPPLVEFEENLLDGVGAGMGQHTFRLMDPVSQKMMGVRADMTPQVARIAATRLVNSPRPLRLAYGGSVLRVRGSQLRPERQFREAGCELIGVDTAAADAETVVLAASSLMGIGVPNLSVDLSLPSLVGLICEGTNTSIETVEDALDRKDASGLEGVDAKVRDILKALLHATGPADQALSVMSGLDLPEPAAAEVTRLRDVVDLIAQAKPDLIVTVDPVEHRGFEYQDGVSFTIFARNVRGEIGRGGRYNRVGTAEPGTGFTLYLDTVMRAIPSRPALRKIFLPAGEAQTTADQLRAEGHVVLVGLEPSANPVEEAKRLLCSDIYLDGSVQELENL